MRRYLNLFMVLVTLSILGGCAGTSTTTPQPDTTMRTPTGHEISDRVPHFDPQAPSTGEAPLETAASGRHAVTPYYQDSAQHSPTQAPSVLDMPEVKVAVLVPLSGAQADLGQAMLNAAQLALFDVNASNITLVPQDTTTGAAQAAKTALDEGAQIILGPLFAQDVKAVSPIAQSRNVPVIAFSTDWSAATANTYIMGFLPFGQVSRVLDYAARRGVKNVSALIPQTPYGTAVNSSLKYETQRQNMAAANVVTFTNATLPQAVTQISATQHGDALVLPIGGAQLTQMATQLRQNNWNFGYTRLLGTGLWDDSPQAASTIPGGWYAAPDPRLRMAFNSKYQQTFGAMPPRLSTLAYDATALAAALAMKGLREGNQPAYSRADITNPNGFAGIDGVFRFRNDSLAERALAILELRTGGSAVIDPAPTRF